MKPQNTGNYNFSVSTMVCMVCMVYHTQCLPYTPQFQATASHKMGAYYSAGKDKNKTLLLLQINDFHGDGMSKAGVAPGEG